ncbi:MAG: hypothetical protein K1X75_01580 [Leptospirales bacterium]|nr:hypothetical protein [Leptospirales bacterium]
MAFAGCVNIRRGSEPRSEWFSAAPASARIPPPGATIALYIWPPEAGELIPRLHQELQNMIANESSLMGRRLVVFSSAYPTDLTRAEALLLARRQGAGYAIFCSVDHRYHAEPNLPWAAFVSPLVLLSSPSHDADMTVKIELELAETESGEALFRINGEGSANGYYLTAAVHELAPRSDLFPRAGKLALSLLESRYIATMQAARQ